MLKKIFKFDKHSVKREDKTEIKPWQNIRKSEVICNLNSVKDIKVKLILQVFLVLQRISNFSRLMKNKAPGCQLRSILLDVCQGKAWLFTRQIFINLSSLSKGRCSFIMDKLSGKFSYWSVYSTENVVDYTNKTSLRSN